MYYPSQVCFTPSLASGDNDTAFQLLLRDKWSRIAVTQPSRVARSVADALAMIDATSTSNNTSDVIVDNCSSTPADGASTHVLACGSLYLVGAILEHLKWPVDEL